MASMTFLKRKFGNPISISFGIIGGIIGLFILLFGQNYLRLLYSIPMLVVGLLFIFGKEYVEVNFEQQYIKEYFSLLWIKSGKSKPLPTIDHILLRDIYTNANYSTMSAQADYYELSLCYLNKSQKLTRIILSINLNKKRMKNYIETLKGQTNLPIRDKTNEKLVEP
jgi:hypothetical protein